MRKFPMTATAGNTQTCSPTGQERTRHVLLRDDLGRLTLRHVRPWHRLLARCAAARLDRELAAGTPPETSAGLAARAMALTSAKARRDLATSVPVNRARISQAAVPLAHLAECLAAPGPVPVQGVAMVSRLLADGTGPLYREASGDDLGDIIENASQALSR